MKRLILLVAGLVLLSIVMVAAEDIRYYPGTTVAEYDPQAIIVWDDFVTGGSAGKLGWSNSGTTVSANTGTLFADRPGLLSLTNAASATGGMVLVTNNAFTSRYANVDTVIFWVAANTGANDPDEKIGLSSGSVGAAFGDDSVHFEHLAADTNWFAVTRDGAAETRRDTNVPFAANTFFKLMIKHPSSTQWDFYINGTLTNSLTSGNLPTESYVFNTMFQMVTHGTAVPGYFDYFWMKYRTSR